MALLRAFLQDENGAAAIEYALIVSLISVAIIGSLTLVGNNLSSLFNIIGQHMVAR